MATGDLPAQLTPFIGRTEELAVIAHRLDDPHCRLLTLVGPGGIGKTRLAIEAASRRTHAFPDGVFFVGLQPIASIDNIIPTVANAVGFEFYEGHHPTAQLLRYLHERCLLLILDNFEHLLPETDVVIELLNGAPQLKLLITSRAALNLREEWLCHVEGMTYPQDESVDAIDAYSAVKLFVERAQRARHSFSLVDEAASVVRVCQLVDGMPLVVDHTRS
jgi:predicted ATPase